MLPRSLMEDIIHSILDTSSPLCRHRKHRKRFPRAALKKRSARAAPRERERELLLLSDSRRTHSVSSAGTLHLSQWHSWTSSLSSLYVQYKCDSSDRTHLWYVEFQKQSQNMSLEFLEQQQTWAEHLEDKQ